MKAESKTIPQPFIIEYCDERTEIILTESVVETTREDETIYQYDEYRLNITDRPNLDESVETNFAEWLNFAKESENYVPTPNIEERVSTVETIQTEVIRILSEVLI